MYSYNKNIPLHIHSAENANLLRIMQVQFDYCFLPTVVLKSASLQCTMRTRAGDPPVPHSNHFMSPGF